MGGVNAIPEGYTSVTPYLFISGATEALAFYKNVFGAEERLRIPGPNNTVGHAEIAISGAVIMLADECPQLQCRSPKTIGGSPVMVHLYVDDADAVVKKATAAGATVIDPVADKFYGDRSGSIVDPWGHLWAIATHVEDVSPEEIQKRLAAMAKK
jgi:PhnB protein